MGCRFECQRSKRRDAELGERWETWDAQKTSYVVNELMSNRKLAVDQPVIYSFLAQGCRDLFTSLTPHKHANQDYQSITNARWAKIDLLFHGAFHDSGNYLQ